MPNYSLNEEKQIDPVELARSFIGLDRVAFLKTTIMQ